MKNGMHVDEWGSTRWFKNGGLHRLDGPACEYADGDKAWFLNGQLHREDGPAVIFANGTKWWFLNSLKHRVDGPAIEYANGSKEWWLNGHQYYLFDNWLKELEVSDEDKLILTLKWV